MNQMLKDILILLTITAVTGLGLGFAFHITKDARTEQENKTKLSAYQEVMPQMDDYEIPNDIHFEDINQAIVVKNSNIEKNNKITPIKPFQAKIQEVVLAKDQSGEKIGYIITVEDKEAYNGSITMAVGITKDTIVKGISFLSISETPGLGMNAGEGAFKNQFQDKRVDYFVYTKTNSTSDNEIDAISSATITTNAVTHGVNAAIYCVEYLEATEKNKLPDIAGGKEDESVLGKN